MDLNEYHLLVTIEYRELEFSHLDEESEEEVAPSKYENIMPISTLEVTLDKMATAPSEAASSIANPQKNVGD